MNWLRRKCERHLRDAGPVTAGPEEDRNLIAYGTVTTTDADM